MGEYKKEKVHGETQGKLQYLPCYFLPEDLFELLAHEAVDDEVGGAVDDEEPVHEARQAEEPGGRHVVVSALAGCSCCTKTAPHLQFITAHLKVLLMMNSATLMMSLGKWQRRNMMTMQMRTVARFTSLCEELFLLDRTWAYLHKVGTSSIHSSYYLSTYLIPLNIAVLK